MPNTIVRIGLVMTHTLDFYRQVLRGVKAFAVERPNWVFSPIAPEKRAIELARPLRCDGYLAHVFTQPLTGAVGKLDKILDGRAAEAVEGLIVVAHHANVLVTSGEFEKQLLLDRVRILVLVDYDVLEDATGTGKRLKHGQPRRGSFVSTSGAVLRDFALHVAHPRALQATSRRLDHVVLLATLS